MMETDPVLVVNVDIAFLVNFATDLAWLWVTARLAGLHPRRWRIAPAAAVGAAAAVWAYFPSGRWLASGPGAVAGTAALLTLAFAPCRVRDWGRAAAYFLPSGAAMAGMAMVVGTRFAGAGGIVPGGLVATGVCLCYAGGSRLWAATRQRRALDRAIFALRVRMGDRSVELPALVDTGHALQDPLSGAPVVVVESVGLEGIVPETLLHAVAAGWEGLDRLPEDWAGRCRLVPFRAVGRPAGVLLAFVPDELSLRQQGAGPWHPVRGLVGLAGHQLHPDRTYQALLPPRLLDEVGGPGSAWEGETG